MSQTSRVVPNARPAQRPPRTSIPHGRDDKLHSAVFELARIAAASPGNATRVLEGAARLAAKLCDASIAFVLLLQDREISVAAHHPRSRDKLRRDDWPAEAEDIARQAIERGVPIQAATNVSHDGVNDAGAPRSLCAVPIVSAGSGVVDHDFPVGIRFAVALAEGSGIQ